LRHKETQVGRPLKALLGVLFYGLVVSVGGLIFKALEVM